MITGMKRDIVERLYAAGVIDEIEYLKSLGYEDPEAEQAQRHRAKLDGLLAPVVSDLTGGLKACRHFDAGSQPAHPCPFLADVRNDSATMCLCCDACTTECARSI